MKTDALRVDAELPGRLGLARPQGTSNESPFFDHGLQQIQTGRIEREHQPIYKKLKLLLLFNPLTEWIDTTQTMRLHAYKESVSAGMQLPLQLTPLEAPLTPRYRRHRRQTRL